MTDAALPDKATANRAASAGLIRRALDSDIFYSFRRSKLTMVAAAITILFFLLAIFAPLLSVQNPFDPGQLQLINSRISPLWTARRGAAIASRKKSSVTAAATMVSLERRNE